MYIPHAAVVLVNTAMITIVADPFKAHLSHLSSTIFWILPIAALHVSVVGINMAEIKNDYGIFWWYS